MSRRQRTDKHRGPSVRCAIYTRKSTEEGLEQEFNTLDAQRESGEAYVASQKNEGWECLPERYDDGGFTGGNLERPALKRLLADVEAGRGTESHRATRTAWADASGRSQSCPSRFNPNRS